MNIPKPDVLNNYLRHVEINTYLDYLGNRYKSFVSVYTIGKSYEGRAIKAIKIDLFKDKKYKEEYKEQNKDNSTRNKPKENNNLNRREEIQSNQTKPKEQQSHTNNVLRVQSSKPYSNSNILSTETNTSENTIKNSKRCFSAALPDNLNVSSGYFNSLSNNNTNNCNTNNDNNYAGNSNKKFPKRKWILIEGGTHAREWITITVALYCIHQLTEKFCRNIEILQKAKFLIIPLVNSDGYEYSRLKNRRWRKNRKPNASTSRSIGTDCNRNYDFHWENGSNTTSKCTYRGDTPFSEPETRAIKQVLERLAPNLIFFISLHSCAQTIMYPWGYTKDLPETWAKLQSLAEYGKKAIQKATGRKYRCGSISQVTNRTYSGSIVDYAFGIQKVPFTMVMELPSKKLGFQPPKEKIHTIGDESWIGIKAMCNRVLEL